tara:strand:+ start:461 stop:1360 length:900 start_codon:yes stop_codon:yes gene_type:complete
MVNGGTTITQDYDAWGRLTSKGDGTYSATYAYRYGSKLYSVTSDFPGEGNVTYETGGDGKRRSRTQGLNELWFNWDIGWNVVSQEDDADGSTGVLTMTHVLAMPGAEVSHMLADLASTTPSTGTVRYYATDHLGSTRSVYDVAKASVGSYEYTPYGDEYVYAGASLESLGGAFTGKVWDVTVQMYYFPYRYYSPSAARWTSRDPLGMVDGPNIYSYVVNNPMNRTDALGLSWISEHAQALRCALAVAALILAIAVMVSACSVGQTTTPAACFAAIGAMMIAMGWMVVECEVCKENGPGG